MAEVSLGRSTRVQAHEEVGEQRLRRTIFRTIAKSALLCILSHSSQTTIMTAIATQQEGSAPGPSSAKLSSSFDIVAAYHHHLSSSPSLPHPIAAINALCDLITHSTSSISTVSELISLIQIHSTHLKSSLANPVPARAGTDLFSRFVISMDWREDVVQGGFEGNKERLVQVAREYCDKTVPACRRRICQRSNVFIREGAVTLVGGMFFFEK